MFCRSLFVPLSFFFWHLLPVRLQFMASEQPFGIFNFKLFLNELRINIKIDTTFNNSSSKSRENHKHIRSDNLLGYISNLEIKYFKILFFHDMSILKIFQYICVSKYFENQLFCNTVIVLLVKTITVAMYIYKRNNSSERLSGNLFMLEFKYLKKKVSCFDQYIALLVIENVRFLSFSVRFMCTGNRSDNNMVYI